jgi:hypothetical protein
MAKTKMRWFSRFSLETTAHTAYRMLVDRDKRALSAVFVKNDEKILMLFARGAKVAQLRAIAKLGAPVASDIVRVPTDGSVSAISGDDQGVLQMGARIALKAMRRTGRDILVCSFSEPVIEPLLLVYARGAVVDDMIAQAYTTGLLDKPAAEAA